MLQRGNGISREESRLVNLGKKKETKDIEIDILFVSKQNINWLEIKQ